MTARCAVRTRSTTDTWPGVWPGVGSRRTPAHTSWSMATRSARPASTMGRPSRRRGVAVGVRVVVPVLELGRHEQIAGVRERRHPLAVDEPRVPAHVVDVQVGAHDDVDRVGREAGGHHVVEERQLQLVPPGVGPGLVVADARVDGDARAVDVDDEALDALEEVAAARRRSCGCQPRRPVGDVHHPGLVHLREQEPGRGHHLDLDDRRDRGSSDGPSAHGPHRSSSCQWPGHASRHPVAVTQTTS